MIKEYFTFKKTSWHMKLMRWIWGYEPDNFRNMCPYFWLSVFNVVFIIPIVLIKLIVTAFRVLIKLMSGLIEAYDAYCLDKQIKWVEEMKVRVDADINSLSRSELLKRLIKYDLFYQGLNRAETEWWDSLSYEKRIEILNLAKKESTEEYNAKNAIKLERRATKEQRIAKATRTIKKGAKLLGLALCIASGYVMYVFVKFLIGVDWAFVWDRAKHVGFVLSIVIGFVVVVVITLVCVYKGIKALICRYGKYCIPCSKRRESISSVVGSTFHYISIPFIATYDAITSFIEIIRELKKDNCPGIEWE